MKKKPCDDIEDGVEGLSGENANERKRINIEVAYARADRQIIIALEIEEGKSVIEALRLSGIAQEFQEIDPDHCDLGIFGKHLDGKQNETREKYILKEGDRIEIYRPLLLDPKAARLKRAEQKKQKARKTQREQ